ncbi:MAG: prolipoprotein diacylglyceryl transferase [Bdellovibrionota bacterium]
MIPYFQIPPLHIGELSIHAFEVLTSLGIYLGIQRTLSMAKARNLDSKHMIDAILISIVCGFVGAHLMHVTLYERDFSSAIKLLKIGQGISSTGGFLFGGLACWIFLRVKKLSVLDYGDCMIGGLLLAQFFGRLGCFTAHDHPGMLSSVPWAVMFPDGARHDLGFEEAVLVGSFLLVTLIPAFKNWLNRQSGRWMISGMIFYGAMRFVLDFLRARDVPNADPRYWGLTPAQFICLVFIGVTVALK